MLRKHLSRAQWLSLLLLFVGVSVVQLQEQAANSKIPVATTNSSEPSIVNPTKAGQSPLTGISAVVVACVLSGFSGVYFEKILKSTDDVSVWMRNIQLAVLSVPIAYLAVQVQDGAAIAARAGGSLFYGYDALVWTIIAVYAIGGLTVAVVMKYADNILKVEHCPS